MKVATTCPYIYTRSVLCSTFICTGSDPYADFDVGPHIVEFSINTTMVLFDIAITGDNILEIDENFMFTIDATQLIPQVFLGNISQATALITDDDREYNSVHA